MWMWENVTRTSGRYGCGLEWSGIYYEPLPQVQEAPYDRVVPAADKRLLRKSQGVSISRLIDVAIGAVPGANPKKQPGVKLGSFGESETSQECSYSV